MSNKQEDHDLYQLASIIDAALTSDTPAVKKALRNFLLVASIAEANEDNPTGPITKILNRLDGLEQKVSRLQDTVRHNTSTISDRKKSPYNYDYLTNYGPDYRYTANSIKADHSYFYDVINRLSSDIEGKK